MSMTISEKVAYLKGLLEGMDNKDKVTSLIVDILRDIALEIEDLSDTVDMLDDEVLDISECIDDMNTNSGKKAAYSDDSDEEDEDEDDFDFDSADDEMYELVCPTCGEVICIDEDIFNEGSMSCPNCGEIIEFDSEISEDEDGSWDESDWEESDDEDDGSDFE